MISKLFGADGDEQDSDNDRATAAGRLLGRGFVKGLAIPGRFLKVFLRTIATGTTRRLPFVGSSFWRSMIKMSTKQYQKATGADVVNFSAEPGGIEPRAANWQEADPDNPDTRPGWTEVSGDKTWGPGSEGRDVERFGKADIIITDRSAHETATPLKMRYAEALDLEQVDGLIEGATVQQTIIDRWPADPSEIDADQTAVADGGQFAERQRGPLQVDASDAGFKDAVVDLASDFGDGKGMRVSARKYKEQYLTSTDVEEMKKQETRGFLAGKSGRDETTLVKLFIIALAAIVAVAVGPTLVQVLFGGGGGGGGALPIMASLGMW